MRLSLCGVIVCFALPCGAGSLEIRLPDTRYCSTDIRWPDAHIPIPSEVSGYILNECATYEGFSEESVDDCMRGESYGYRAVVTMLRDATLGDLAAERYRACAAGLGDHGGRFHRRKAECISEAYGVVWRFEFMQETTLGDTRFASRVSDSPSSVPGSAAIASKDSF